MNKYKTIIADDQIEDYIDQEYHEASMEELIKMGCFDNLNK